MKNFKETMERVQELHESVAIKTRGGKTYTQVVHRMQAFREMHGLDYGVDTHLVHDDGVRVIVKAVITNREGFVIGSGYAEEIRETEDQRKVNYTSAIENCETSAVGRALASIGLSGGEYASMNELDAVSRKTEAKKTAVITDVQKAELEQLFAETKADPNVLFEFYQITNLAELPAEKFSSAKSSLVYKKTNMEKANGEYDQASEPSGEGRPSSKDKSAEVLAELRANMGVETQGAGQ